MNMNMNKLGELIGEYEGKWVAISPDRKEIWASSDTLDELNRILIQKSIEPKPIFYKVLPLEFSYSPLMK